VEIKNKTVEEKKSSFHGYFPGILLQVVMSLHSAFDTATFELS
jgi:hypothetical protein